MVSVAVGSAAAGSAIVGGTEAAGTAGSAVVEVSTRAVVSAGAETASTGAEDADSTVFSTSLGAGEAIL